MFSSMADVQGQSGRDYRFQLFLVADLSLGQSAVYAVVSLADHLSRGALTQAQAQVNTSLNPRPWFDLVYQLLGITFALVPVVLALYFMRSVNVSAEPGLHSGKVSTEPGMRAEPRTIRQVCHHIGFDFRRPLRDCAYGGMLFLVIGAGSLGVYAAGRALGLTAEVVPNALGHYWWSIPVLVLLAIKNGVLEEVVLLGFGYDRLEKLGAKPWLIILGLALFRGSYHLYQGVGPFVGNVIMGIIFGFLVLRSGSVMPCVIAHSAVDIAGFTVPGILAAVDPA